MDAETQFTIAALVPDSWRANGNRLDVLVVGCECFRVRSYSVPVALVPMDTGPDVRTVLVRGKLYYLGAGPTVVRQIAGKIQVDSGAVEQRTTHEGTFVLLLAPLRDGPGAEVRSREAIDTALGTARLIWGANFATTRVCEYRIDVDSGQVTLSGAVIRNPMTRAAVDLNEQTLEDYRTFLSTVTALPEKARKEIDIGLRWYAQSLDEKGGDAFLKAWIAIEAVSMLGDSNIRPLKHLLAAAYSTSHSEITAMLGIGLMATARSRIVHGGALDSTHGAILDHAQAVFGDALRARLQLPCIRAAARTAPEALPVLKELVRQDVP